MDLTRFALPSDCNFRCANHAICDIIQEAAHSLTSSARVQVELYKRLDAEARDSLQSVEQQRRQLTDLTLAVNANEDELKQDPLRKKGAQLTADKRMYEEQLRDLNEQEDDETLPFEEVSGGHEIRSRCVWQSYMAMRYIHGGVRQSYMAVRYMHGVHGSRTVGNSTLCLCMSSTPTR